MFQHFKTLQERLYLSAADWNRPQGWLLIYVPQPFKGKLVLFATGVYPHIWVSERDRDRDMDRR